MFSLVILHHNKAAYSRACLESLLGMTARPLQVVNVDNGSRDETPQVLNEWESVAREHGIETVRLSYEENIGAIRGRNEALVRATGQYLGLLDNDILISQADWMERLRDFLDADPQRAVAAPKLLFPWEPFPIECCGARVSPGGRVQYVGRGEARASFAEPFEIPCAISAAWVMTRGWWEHCGPLDEVYSPVQYEDLDFCYQVRAQGGQVWAVPQVEAMHWEHTTTAGSSDINFRYVTVKNSLTFKKRWEATFRDENGPPDTEARWGDLPKKAIDEVDWRAWLPVAAPPGKIPVNQPSATESKGALPS